MTELIMRFWSCNSCCIMKRKIKNKKLWNLSSWCRESCSSLVGTSVMVATYLRGQAFYESSVYALDQEGVWRWSCVRKRRQIQTEHKGKFDIIDGLRCPYFLCHARKLVDQMILYIKYQILDLCRQSIRPCPTNSHGYISCIMNYKFNKINSQGTGVYHTPQHFS